MAFKLEKKLETKIGENFYTNFGDYLLKQGFKSVGNNNHSKVCYHNSSLQTVAVLYQNPTIFEAEVSIVTEKEGFLEQLVKDFPELAK